MPEFDLQTEIAKGREVWPTIGALAWIDDITHIAVVENDLYTFRDAPKESTDWDGMVGEWLGRGAVVDIYSQDIHPEAIPPLRQLRDRFELLSVFNYSTLRDKLRTHHFILFTRPDDLTGDINGYNIKGSEIPYQLWIEGEHLPGENVSSNAQYWRVEPESRRYSPEIVESQMQEVRKYQEILAQVGESAMNITWEI